MKRSLIAMTALLCIGAPGAAVADDAADAVTEQLRDRVHYLSDKVDHKSDVLACERNRRRELERALRDGTPVGLPTSCR